MDQKDFSVCHIDSLGVVFEGLVLVEPLHTGAILLCVQLHLNGLQRLNIQDVVCVIQRRLLIIEGWEAHALEVPSVSLLTTHHNPHSTTETHREKCFHINHRQSEQILMFRDKDTIEHTVMEDHFTTHPHCAM